MFPPQGIAGVSKHVDLTDKEVAGVIDHADGSVAAAKVGNLPASKITTERFGMARMPDLPIGHILLGRGYGQDYMVATSISTLNTLEQRARKTGADWDAARSVAWSPDGKYVAIASNVADAVEVVS